MSSETASAYIMALLLSLYCGAASQLLWLSSCFSAAAAKRAQPAAMQAMESANKNNLTATFGGSYKCCKSSLLRGKITTKGELSGSANYQFSSDFSLTGSATVDLHDSTKHSCGLQVNLG